MPNFRNLMSGDSGGVSLVEVGNSALFDRANSEYLSRTYGTPTDQDVFTLSMWLLPQNFAGFGGITGGAAANTDLMYISPAEVIVYALSGSGVTTVPVRRDIGWGHFVWQINGTTVKTYWNSVLVSTDTKTVSDYNSAVTHTLGSYNGNANHYNGYMAETVFIDGLALEPTSFGEYDTTGLYWTPKSSDDIKALTFGNNGFYLDNTTNAETDASGNGNNFTNNNTVVTTTHTMTNGETLFNPINTTFTNPASASLSNGNRTFYSAGGYRIGVSTLNFPTTGKWWVAVEYAASPAMTATPAIGITRGAGTSYAADSYLTYQQTDYSYSYIGTTIRKGSASGTDVTTGLTAQAAGDFMLIAFDADNQTVKWYLENALEYTLDLSSAPDGYYGNDGGWSFAVATYTSGPKPTLVNTANYGYTPPTGYEELNTTNIAAATTRTQSDPYEHFANITRTGTGAIATVDISAQTPNGSDFNPGLVWSKNRVDAVNHRMFSSLLAQPYYSLRPDVTNAVSTTQTDSLTAFGTGDYTLGADTAGPVVNANTKNYIDWVFKLGGAASTNEDGSIDSSVSVNQTLGMSVGTYTGNATGGATIGHGLNVTPGMVIVKNIDYGSGGWSVYHKDLNAVPEDYYIFLHTTSAAGDNASYWNDTAPTTSVFSIGSNDHVNRNTDTHMFIAFAPSEYISIGSYTGNANTNGTFVPTLNSLGVPLQPIFHLTKRSSATGSWKIIDAGRSTYNQTNAVLTPDTAAVEGTAQDDDLLSGGFKWRASDSDVNGSGTYVHLTIGTPIIDVDGRIIAGR